jgi:archaellum biogenesis ATPase FlaH
MDYFGEMKQRVEWYKNDEESIPFDIDAINKAMGGGLKRKATAVFIAPPKRGKSLWMCHCAASLIRTGKNVLYVSCELSEKMITKRIDANLLDIPMNDLGKDIDEKAFTGKFKSLLAKTHGELIVKEFPSINSLQLNALLHDLAQKKKFKPDVIILDYVNICSSSYLNASHVGNTNLYIGKIVMEMRNVAIEHDVAMLSAVQNNRGGVKKTTDTGMDDIADAFSIAMNVDWGGAIIQNDDLRKMKRYLLKTVLTRWDENSDDIYSVGVEYNKMRLTNLAEDEQVISKEMEDRLKSVNLRDKKKEDQCEEPEVKKKNGFDFA